MDLTKSIVGSGDFRAKRVTSCSATVSVPPVGLIIETVCSDKHIIFHSKNLVEIFDQQKKLRIMKDKIATSVKVNGPYSCSESIANEEFYIIPAKLLGNTHLQNVCYSFDANNVTKAILVGEEWITLPFLEFTVFRDENYLMLIMKERETY
jgi:hypothetical protein